MQRVREEEKQNRDKKKRRDRKRHTRHDCIRIGCYDGGDVAYDGVVVVGGC